MGEIFDGRIVRSIVALWQPLFWCAAVADYLVVDRDKIGIQCGRRQNHIIVCLRFLGNRDTGGR